VSVGEPTLEGGLYLRPFVCRKFWRCQTLGLREFWACPPGYFGMSDR
jgi:hypothetical protein